MIRRLLGRLGRTRKGEGRRWYPCPRCGEQVGVSGLMPIGVAHRFGYAGPTIAAVAAECGCEAAGRPAVPEWPERARRRLRTW